MLRKSILFLLNVLTIFFMSHYIRTFHFEANAQFLRKDKPYSDHYGSNSKIFFNPGAIDTNDWYNYLFMYFYENAPKWPKQTVQVADAPSSRAEPHQIFFNFIGHSTFYIQMEGVGILTDPIFSKEIGPIKYFGFKRAVRPSTQPELLPGVDIVLISNNKYDHLDIETIKVLERLFHPQFVVPLGVGLFLKKLHVKNIIEMDWFEKSTVSGFQVTMLPAQNSSGRSFNDRNTSLWGSYALVSPQQKSFYYIGESGVVPNLKVEVKKQFASFDLCLFPIGASEPKWYMGYYNMNPREALELAQSIDCRAFVGHRFGSFQIGTESSTFVFDEIKKLILSGNFKFPIIYPNLGKNYFYPDKLN